LLDVAVGSGMIGREPADHPTEEQRPDESVDEVFLIESRRGSPAFFPPSMMVLNAPRRQFINLS